jgi:hypothetical protein
MIQYGAPDGIINLFSDSPRIKFRMDEIGDDDSSQFYLGGHYNWRYDAMGGDDTIMVFSGATEENNTYAVNLGAGDDFFFGQGEKDIVLGGSGRDSLIGGAGKDKLFGQGGDDYLSNGGGGSYDVGPEILNGGKGNDVYDISGYTSVYDNGGKNNIYNVDQDSESHLYLGKQSSGFIHISGDNDDMLFFRLGKMLLFENKTDGAAAYIENYFVGEQKTVSGFSSDEGTVYGAIHIADGMTYNFNDLL